MKLVLVSLVLSVLCMGSVLSISETTCSNAVNSCRGRYPSVSSSDPCSEKKPFFDCVLSDGCEVSHNTYKSQVSSKSYGDCDSGSGNLIMGWTLPLLLVISGKFVTL